MRPLIEISALTKNYGKTVALNNVFLNLYSGNIIGLLGPNGSGKTTLIKLIMGLLTPTSGQILIDGQKPSAKTKAMIAYLPDKEILKGSMEVDDIVDMFADFYADFNIEKAYTMLNELGINPNSKYKSLSKGMKEKVQLVLVMSRDAKIYLLDEPIGGVDPASREYILNTIIRNYNPEALVLISTHLVSDIEKVLDQVIFINYAEVGLVTTVDEVRQKYQKSIDEFFREVYKC